MSARRYPIASASEVIAHGLTPKAIQSVADFNQRLSNRKGYERCASNAQRLYQLAREVDALTGYYAQFRGRKVAA